MNWLVSYPWRKNPLLLWLYMNFGWLRMWKLIVMRWYRRWTGCLVWSEFAGQYLYLCLRNNRIYCTYCLWHLVSHSLSSVYLLRLSILIGLWCLYQTVSISTFYRHVLVLVLENEKWLMYRCYRASPKDTIHPLQNWKTISKCVEKGNLTYNSAHCSSKSID